MHGQLAIFGVFGDLSTGYVWYPIYQSCQDQFISKIPVPGSVQVYRDICYLLYVFIYQCVSLQIYFGDMFKSYLFGTKGNYHQKDQ